MEPSYASDLLRRQEALQAEAHTVLAHLDLMAVLARAGQPVLVGSAALGLMTWRDIDVEVYCNRCHWSADHAFETMRPLASYARVKKLRYSNERGPLRSAGSPNGYYWGMRYYTEAGDEWKIDVWFLPDDAPRPGITHTIPERLTPERRLAILWIKDVWHRLPTYRHGVSSVDIYDAVLEQGAQAPAEFDAYLRARGKPARELQ